MIDFKSACRLAATDPSMMLDYNKQLGVSQQTANAFTDDHRTVSYRPQ